MENENDNVFYGFFSHHKDSEIINQKAKEFDMNIEDYLRWCAVIPWGAEKLLESKAEQMVKPILEHNWIKYIASHRSQKE